MKIDRNIATLPLTKTKPESLNTLFGSDQITPMWVADMDFAVAEPIQKALIDRITGSGFGYEYRPESYFKALSDFYKRHYGIRVTREEIRFSPSIITSLSVILDVLTEKGNGIIIQPPVFMEFRDVIRKTGRRVVKNPLLLQNRHYTIDFDDLVKKAADENTKALIFCNPHNPVGRVWTPEEIEQVVQICKKHQILLISDEIHKDIVLFGNTFTSLLNFTGIYENIVVCTSEAKTFNLPGISDSMMLIRDEDIRKTVQHRLKYFDLGRTNALTRIALETAYNSGDEWLKSLNLQIEKNVNLIARKLQQADSKIKLVKPEGTYQVWLDFRALFEDSKVMFRKVTDATGIGMNAGHWFGREGALFMRMNIATSEENVEKAIKKLISFAAEL